MGLFGGDKPRVIKGAGIDPEDGMICGEFVWDQKSRHTMHGSDPKWQAAVAKGNLRRMNEKPKPAPWSRETRKPDGSPRGRRP